MGGNRAGGLKAARKNKKNYARFYNLIGAAGGRFSTADGVIKGFALDRELAKRAGALGGLASGGSRKGPRKVRSFSVDEARLLLIPLKGKLSDRTLKLCIAESREVFWFKVE